MPLERSDWFTLLTTVIAFGGGLFMTSMSQQAISVAGIVISPLGIVGLAVWIIYYRKRRDKTLPNVGDNNTLVRVEPCANMGSGNTIIGATDARGNTIFNRGGTAIGAGAETSPTGIAIGANAKAGRSSSRPTRS